LVPFPEAITVNFDKPDTKDFTETVRLLCNLSHFVIVDITNPRSAPLELQATVPDYMVPFVPILQVGEEPFAMFVDLQDRYDRVLKPVMKYLSLDRLIERLESRLSGPPRRSSTNSWRAGRSNFVSRMSRASEKDKARSGRSRVTRCMSYREREPRGKP